jgi:hypothetical protein
MVLRLLRLSVDVVIPAPAVAPAAAPTTAAVVVVAVPLAPPHYRPSLSLLSSECSWLLALWAVRVFCLLSFCKFIAHWSLELNSAKVAEFNKSSYLYYELRGGGGSLVARKYYLPPYRNSNNITFLPPHTQYSPDNYLNACARRRITSCVSWRLKEMLAGCCWFCPHTPTLSTPAARAGTGEGGGGATANHRQTGGGASRSRGTRPRQEPAPLEPGARPR